MEMIDQAFTRALSLRIVTCIILIAAVVLCVLLSGKKKNTELYAVAIGIFLIIYVATSAFPLLKDYVMQDVIQVDAIYVNTGGDAETSSSSIFGMHSVTLKTAEGDINLTTAPFSDEVFPTGEYPVRAWYAKNSKTLLYIESKTD